MIKSLVFILFFGLSLGIFDHHSKVDLDLGQSYLALTVKDIQSSFDFYQQLGFEPVNGTKSLDQRFILLQNGATKIGLFQGFFPKNTLTFNPDDARAIYQQTKAQGISIDFQQGMDVKQGPCSFMITDPDGNPILIDQH